MILLLPCVFIEWEWIIRSVPEISGCWPLMRVTVDIRVRYNNSIFVFLIGIQRETPIYTFPGIEDVREGVESVSLEAVSDCGLPIYYYVKEGPAELQDNRLVFTKIPPRSKFPVKVTVVAWQYGIAGQVQTAEPVERSFL